MAQPDGILFDGQMGDSCQHTDGWLRHLWMLPSATSTASLLSLCPKLLVEQIRLCKTIASLRPFTLSRQSILCRGMAIQGKAERLLCLRYDGGFILCIYVTVTLS